MAFPAKSFLLLASLAQAQTYNIMAVAGRGPFVGQPAASLALVSTALAVTPAGDVWVADNVETGQLLLITSRGTVARIVRPQVARDLYFSSLAVGRTAICSRPMLSPIGLFGLHQKRAPSKCLLDRRRRDPST